MSALAFSFRRMRLIAVCSVREIFWQQFARLVFLIALGAVAAMWFLMAFNFGESSERFITGFGLGVTAALGSVLVAVTGAQLFFTEVEQGIAALALTKPMRRSEWVMGKLAALVIMTALFCVVLTLTMAALVWLKVEGVPVSAYVRLAGAGFLQWLKLSVFAAMVLFIAVLSRGPLVATVSGLAVAFICHFQATGLGVYDRSSSQLVRALAAGGRMALPDFNVFDPATSVPLGAWVGTAVIQAAFYLVLFTTLANLRFRSREF